MLQHLRNARLFAPRPLGVVDLLIADRRIAWIGRGDDATPSLPRWLPHDVVDLRGRTVTPALIDLHVHTTGGGGEAGPGSRIPPLAAASFFEGAIGTVVGLLGTDDTTRTTGSLVAWTREMAAQGVTAYCYTGGYHVPLTTLTGSVRGDLAWVDVVVGVGEVAVSDHRSSQPTVAELRRIAADAHVGGLMTGKAGILHLHVGDGAAGLGPLRAALAGSELPPRVLHPTHVNRRRGLFEEAVEFARQGSTIDVTAFPIAEGEDAWSAAQALQRYLAAGAPPDRITISSDGGGCLPVFDEQGQVAHYDIARPAAVLDALREAVRDGLPLPEALPAFTANPAALLRLPAKGRVQVGADADLAVFDEELNPCGLLLRGRWVRPLAVS